MSITVKDLSPDQLEAYNAIVRWVGDPGSRDLLSLGGAAGSGKSLLVSLIAEQVELPAFCAYTGKAASVLRRKLRDAGTATVGAQKRGRDGEVSREERPYCGTIHSLIYRPCDCREPKIVEIQKPCPEKDCVGETTWASPPLGSQALAEGHSVCAKGHAGLLKTAAAFEALKPKTKFVYAEKVDGRCKLCGGKEWIRREALDRNYSLIIVDECFHYAQPVLTEDGWRPIGTLVHGETRCRVWSLNKQTGALELKPIIGWLKKPAPEELLCIDVGRTDSRRAARRLRVTPAHKILTPSGYVRAGKLKIGDELVVRGRHLTSLQFSVLVGSMLGDGTMGRHSSRNSPQPVFMQGDAQKKWLKFKKAVFGEDMTGPIEETTSGYGDKPVWRFALHVTDQARRVAEEMPHVGRGAKQRRWAPTEKLLSWVDEAALAVWFLDNGSISRAANGKPSASLHTERFDEKTNEKILLFLKKRFGLDSTVAYDTRGYYLLRFGQESTAKLLDIIRPFSPKCMEYKVVGAEFTPPFVPAAEVTTAPIRSIGTVKGRTRGRAYVFDLEVAGHHNYIAGNVVVSNCSMVTDGMLRDLREYDVPILAVGDHFQLPPVGGSGDLMRNPHLRLEKIHRQAEGSPIIALSKIIRETGRIPDDMPESDAVRFGRLRFVEQLIEERYSDASAERLLEMGIACYTNRRRVGLNVAVRRARGTARNGRELPREGEHVVCLRNMKEAGGRPPVANGMRGVLETDATPKQIVNHRGEKIGVSETQLTGSIAFPEDEIDAHSYEMLRAQFGREKTFSSPEELARETGLHSFQMADALFDFGWAMTAHRMQGSQVDDLVAVIERPGPVSDDDWRRWQYTICSRAAKKLLVLR